MAVDRIGYGPFQTTMGRQRVTIHDLYGLLGVLPNVDDAGLSAAYDSIAKKLQQVPSDAINTAYSILANPFKRAQYDRDRLEYLYKHFSSHESFPPTASLLGADVKSRDDQIQVYATNLVDRVKDPTEVKKKAVGRRIETIRNELDDFNEMSGKQRQDWATSGNRVLRMAGNALCEVVVCAEEDLRMLEDELGRIDGTLAPRDLDGPAGRVTSMGYYGSEIMSMPTGATAAMMAPESQPRVLMNQRPISIPRSPTVQFMPLSASKLGIEGPTKDTPSSEGSQDPVKMDGKNRVNEFLLGAGQSSAQPGQPVKANLSTAGVQKQAKARPPRYRASSLLEKLRQTVAQDESEDNFSNTSTGMGLVDWQLLNGSKGAGVTPKNLNDLSAFSKPYDPTHTHSADQLPARQSQLKKKQQNHPAAPGGPWRNSWDPAYFRSISAAPEGRFGLHAAQPSTKGGISATASNTVLFKEVQERAAAAVRASGRWVVGGPGLTTYKEAVPGQEAQKGKEDPFI